MPRKHEPVDKIAMVYESPNDTICEALRDIYWETRNPEIKLKCRIATAMAKSMAAKLTEYNSNWVSRFWDRK